MTELGRQDLWELLDVADVMSRAAGQIRRARAGRPIRDKEVLRRAICFLESAEHGSTYLSTGQLTSEVDSLQPLNWAADAYESKGPEPDYDAIARDLQTVVNVLKYALDAPDPSSLSIQQELNKNEVEQSVEFLSRLGEILSAQVGQRASGDVIELSA